MRLPFPSHLNMQYVLIGLTLLLFAQLLNGTDPLFAVLDCVAMIFSVLAFNVLGGMSRVSGAIVFALALSTYVITIFVKVLTFEPSDKNFLQPLTTITVTALAWFGIMVSAWMSRKFIRPRPLVQFSPRDMENLGNISGALIFMGLLSQILISTYGLGPNGAVENGTFWAALNQMNTFVPLAIVLGTYYVIQMSGGTKSVSWVVVVASLYFGGIGFAAASKQGMYTPAFSYLLVCAGLRYRFRAMQVILIVLWVVFAIGFLFPWAQYARVITRKPTLGQTLAATYDALHDPNTLPAMYRWYRDSQVLNEDVNLVQLCYDHPHGLIDRESLVCSDDALIDLTLHTSTVGPSYLLRGMAMVIPNFMWPGRPSIFLGNVYGRETGLIGDNDEGTQVSFAPVGDAFREFGWSGVTAILPIMFFFTFVVVDNIFGDSRDTPWGLVMVSWAGFAATGLLIPYQPMLWGHIIPMTLALIWITRYVAPQVAVMLGLRKVHTAILPVEKAVES